MPRPPNATQEEVFTAITELETSGIPVTAPALRTKLGGGSLTTLTRHLRVWQARKAEQHVGELPETLRATMATNLEDIVDQVNAAFLELSTRHERALTTLRRSKGQQIAKLKRLLESKDNTIADLERQLLTLETEVRVLREKGR